MAAVMAEPDPAELLVAIGMAVTGLALIRPVVRAYVAWFNRHLMPPVVSGCRASRRDRASRSVVSPAAGAPAVAEVPSPDVSTSATAAEDRR